MTKDKEEKKKLWFFMFALFFVLISVNFIPAQESENICSVYFTGVGCPHCASADPILLEDYTDEYPNFIVIEYEIYQTSENGKVFQEYISNSDAQSGIPQILIGEEKEVGESSSGGGPTTTWTKQQLETLDYTRCMKSNGKSIAFEKLDLGQLPGKPKVWRGER